MLYSLLLHGLAGGLLVLSLDNTPARTIKPLARPQILSAVVVDKARVEAELQRLKDIEDRKIEQQRELEDKLKALEQKRVQTEQQRRLEEKKLAAARKKKAQEEADRKVEQKKLARLKQEQDELEKQKREAEEERKRLEKEAAERKRKEEAERKKKEEQRRREEEEQQRRQAELAEEERLFKVEQARRDQAVIGQFSQRINNAIGREFNIVGLPPGLSCVLQIRMIPGGEVVAAQVVTSSGNEIFDRRAEIAVKRAAPLPVPTDARLFEKMRELRLSFRP